MRSFAGLPLSRNGSSTSSSSISSLVKSVSTSSLTRRRNSSLSLTERKFSPLVEKVFVIFCFLIAGLLLPILFSGATLKTEVEGIIAEANVTMEFVEEEVHRVEEEIHIDPRIANASWQSTAKLLSAMLIGVMTSYAGILDNAAVQSLARLTYYVFMPALMLVSVNKALSSAANEESNGSSTNGLSSRSLLVMPIIGVLHVAMGLLMARLLTWLKPSKDETADRDVWMNCSFGNATPLPLVIATSLFPHGDSLASDMTACISFYTLVESPIFYIFGADLLLTPSEKPPRTKSTTQMIIQSLLNLPMLASLFGVVIGKSAWVQQAIVPGNSLAPVYASIETFAAAYLPSTILVLAGSMSNTQNSSKRLRKSESMGNNSSTDRKIASKNVSFLTIGLTCLSRFILMPILTIGLVSALSPTFLAFETARNKALVSLVILMQGSMPPAQNSALLLTLADRVERASRLTKTLTICYILSIIPVTIWMSRHLQATQILQFVQQANPVNSL